jgi:hypothetical protein
VVRFMRRCALVPEYRSHDGADDHAHAGGRACTCARRSAARS